MCRATLTRMIVPCVAHFNVPFAIQQIQPTPIPYNAKVIYIPLRGGDVPLILIFYFPIVVNFLRMQAGKIML